MSHKKIKWHDFGARYYDPIVGRFMGVDPIAEKFPHVSTYNYAENEPIGHIDLWGLQKAEPSALGTLVESFNQARAGAFNLLARGIGSDYRMKVSYNDDGSFSLANTIYKQEPQSLLSEVKNTAADVLSVAGITSFGANGGGLNSPLLMAKSPGLRNQAAKGLNELKIDIEDINKIDRSLLDAPKVRGNAPTFKKDGTSVEIHHQGQNSDGPFIEMHWESHRGKGNDAINHPNKGLPSKVDRKEFNKAKREYWKQEYPKN